MHEERSSLPASFGIFAPMALFAVASEHCHPLAMRMCLCVSLHTPPPTPLPLS